MTEVEVSLLSWRKAEAYELQVDWRERYWTFSFNRKCFEFPDHETTLEAFRSFRSAFTGRHSGRHHDTIDRHASGYMAKETLLALFMEYSL